jgi:uncharacterized repeat protein (TIGR01451 family)
METAKVLLVMGVCATALSRVAGAQASTGPRALLVTAENLTAVEASGTRGGEHNVLKPGDVVRYQLTFTNTRPDSVRQVQFNDRIPSGLRYVVGSAASDRPDVVVEFSIDSGRTYAARPEIEQVVNGEKVRRPAPPERYTNVRWSAKGWVRARASVTAEFRVQLPPAAAGAGGR